MDGYNSKRDLDNRRKDKLALSRIDNCLGRLNAITIDGYQLWSKSVECLTHLRAKNKINKTEVDEYSKMIKYMQYPDIITQKLDHLKIINNKLLIDVRQHIADHPNYQISKHLYFIDIVKSLFSNMLQLIIKEYVEYMAVMNETLPLMSDHRVITIDEDQQKMNMLNNESSFKRTVSKITTLWKKIDGFYARGSETSVDAESLKENFLMSIESMFTIETERVVLNKILSIENRNIDRSSEIELF